MATILHYPLCPFSRSIRLALAECGVEADLAEERPWEWRSEFVALNPAGTLPVLITEERGPVVGAYAISEYLGDTADERDGRLFHPFPGDEVARAEARRLTDWFHRKFHDEVTSYLVDEKVYRRFGPQSTSPDMEAMRAGHENLRYHLSYIGHLAETRAWLAGDAMSFADLAAAAHLSALDYLGEVPWEEHEQAKNWYALLKSRPSFRPLLQDRVAGFTPSGTYADLDFLVTSSDMLDMAETLKHRIAAEATALGFDAVRFTSADAVQDAGASLDAFLAEGRHGDMDWLGATSERRKAPRALWPEARSVIVLGLNYGRTADPLAILNETSRGAISTYAQGDDYHDVLKAKLKPLAARVQELTQSEVKIFVDTAPVMEKPLAARAGLGWQGKHTNLVSREFGSWLFIGSIFTTAEIAPDTAEEDHCGACRRCLDICPTHAFTAPYQIDARACISYLTIEHKGHIAPRFRAAMGNRIFGCDDCLAVCPWNKFAQDAREAKLAARAGSDNPPLAELLALDDAAFRARFRGTPIKRTGRDRFLRNVLIAAGNSGDTALVPLVEARLSDGSPLVRAMAVWALARLAPLRFGALRGTHSAAESDPAVRSEWLEEAA